MVQTIKTVCHEPVPHRLSHRWDNLVREVFVARGDIPCINISTAIMIVCCTVLFKSIDTHDLHGRARISAPGELVFDGEPTDDDFSREWEFACYHRSGSRIFITEDNCIGLIGEEVMPGDVVCCVAGCRYLTVLRPIEDFYLFVGSCFVMGLTEEVISRFLSRGRLKAKKIAIR